jgi:hypothetical protein
MYDLQFMRRRTPATEAFVKKIAQSTTAGIWRIKRAKLILGAWDGEPIDKLVQSIRVPPQTIMRSLTEFAEKGVAYFTTFDRPPTFRESRVEEVLHLLEKQQDGRKKEWHRLSVHYIGRDFTAYEIEKIRGLIASNPYLTQGEIASELCLMFDLYQSDGKIKRSTAWHIIKRMAIDNMIKLPPPRIVSRKKRGVSSRHEAGNFTLAPNIVTLG